MIGKINEKTTIKFVLTNGNRYIFYFLPSVASRNSLYFHPKIIREPFAEKKFIFENFLTQFISACKLASKLILLSRALSTP